MFSYVDIEARVPKHLLRAMRRLTDEALAELDGVFSALCVWASVHPPERFLTGTLLQLFHSIRSERQQVERIEFDLLFENYILNSLIVWRIFSR